MKTQDFDDTPSSEESLFEEFLRSEKPLPGHIAMKAYFAYLNSGSLDGHDMEHWLEAEKDLVVQQRRARFHGPHN